MKNISYVLEKRSIKGGYKMKNKKNCTKYIGTTNRILLGLLMLIPGLMKLFAYGPSGVTGMLEGLGFPLAGLFAWILIVGEIGSGALLLANKKVRLVVILPIIILLVAAFTAHTGDFTRILMHLVVISNYILIGLKK